MMAETFHLLLGLVWLMEISDASKNPMISSAGSQYCYIALAGVFSLVYTIAMQVMPFSSYERVLDIARRWG